MASPFARTLRALEVDRRAAALRALFVVLALLAAWGVWGLLAEVTLYVQSQRAHVEVVQSTSPIHATRAGRLHRVGAKLGQEVRAGQVLFVLDTAEADLAISELDTEVAGLQAEGEMIEARLAVARAARVDGDSLTKAIKAETRARLDGLEAQAELAERHAERSRRLYDEGTLDLERFERDEAEARRLRFAARALVRARNKEVRSTDLDLSDRSGTIAALEQELRSLGSAIDAKKVARKRLEHRRREMEVESPIDGRIGALAELQAGSWVEPGQELARVVPQGQVRIVGQFRAGDVVGRVRPGQKARVRLDGFPWTQYGTIEAEVTTVAAEARDGSVRIELRVEAEHPGIGVLQHAMPGQVDVAVERIPPFILLLRAAGAWLGKTEVDEATPSP